jgi:hypothetical protein
MAWATDYQAQATQPRSFQFGKENSNHVFDFAPEPTLHAQWFYPADDSAHGYSTHCSGAPSDSISWGHLHEGHPTLPASSDPFAFSSSFESSFSFDSSMPLFNPGGVETSQCSGSESGMPPENGRSDEMGVEVEQSTATTEHNTEASWGERAVFEPDIVPHQMGLTQPRCVRSFFSNLCIC